MNLPIRRPDGGSEIAESGWISGSMGRTLSGYSPALLIIDVQRILCNAGVCMDPTPGMLHTASLAAADLLRALGVTPETAPVASKEEGE